MVFGVAVFFLGLRRSTRFQPHKESYDIGYRLFGLPLWIKRFDLNEVTAVKVEHKIIKSDSDSADHRYIVSLVRMPAQKVATLRSNSLEARRLGERIAKHIRRQLFDGSHGIVIRRTDEELDMSLGERLVHRGEEVEYPSLPTRSRIEPISLGSEIHLRFPAQPLPWFIVALFLLIFTLIAGLSFLAEPGGKIFMQLFSAVCVSFVVIAAINSKQRAEVWITPDGVRYRKFPFRGRLSMSELEEVIAKGSDLTLISDRKIMGLPYDFNRKDRIFVHNLIEHMAVKSHLSGGWARGG